MPPLPPPAGPASAWSLPCSQPRRSLSNGLGLQRLHFHGHCPSLCIPVNITDTLYCFFWVTVIPGAATFPLGASGDPTRVCSLHTLSLATSLLLRNSCAFSLPLSVSVVHVDHSLCLWDWVLLWPLGGVVFVLHEVVGECSSAIHGWAHHVPIQLRPYRGTQRSLAFLSS